MDRSISQSLVSSAYDQPFQMIIRVLGNVVDMQQNMLTNFSNLAAQIESLRVEFRSSLNSLNNKIEDRTDKHIGNMRECHDKEVDRMMRLLENMSIKAQPAPFISPQSASLTMQQKQLGMMQAQAAAHAAYAAGIMNNMGQLSSAQAAQIETAQMAAMRMGGIVPPSLNPVPTNVPQVPVPVVPIAPNIVPAVPNIVPPVVPSPAKPVISFGPTSTSSPAVVKPVAPVAVPSTPSSTATISGTTATASPFSRGYFSKPTEPSPVVVAKIVPTKADDQEEEEYGEPEEYEPTADFRPVIPLPELVEVVTGEENETVLFESRCKVYRFVTETKEWKERGIGQIKILKNLQSGKCRIVMRRDQVHKVCVNHYLDSQMKVQNMKNKPKALMWMCMDSSDGEPECTQLSARFATEDQANEFKKVFEECVAKCPGTSPIETELTKELESPKDEIVIPKNESSSDASSEIEATKGFDWKQAEGSWNCEGCYANNGANSVKCLCCGTGKDGSVSEPELPKSTSSVLAPAAGGFLFGLGASKTTTASGFPLVSSTTTAAASVGSNAIKFSFGQPATLKEDAKTITPAVPNISFGKHADATSTTTTATNGTPIFSFATAAAAAAKDESAKPALPTFNFGKSTSAAPATTSNSSSFSFKGAASPKPGAALFGGSSPSVFGGTATISSTATQSAVPATEQTTDKANIDKPKVFGGAFGGASGSFFFGSSKGNIFSGSAAEDAKKAFSELKKAQPLCADVTEKNNNREDEEGADEEYEPDVQFQPVGPLPDLVDVVTGEENEEVMFAGRCKLYRYDRSTKETKERGLGEIKILKNNEGQYRVVMRRDQVLKLCANFRLLKAMSVNPKKGNPCVYSFWCSDCSEDVSGVAETFFVKFVDEDIAKMFADKFTEGCAASVN